MEFVASGKGSKQPLISVILIDWGVRESFHSLYYLNRQSFPREKYELIWIEFYDRSRTEVTALMDAGGSGGVLDKLILLQHSTDTYYHKHLMYNVGIVAAEGSICVFCDSDAIFPPSFLDSLYRAFTKQSRLAVHVDEVRSESRKFFPFNYPTVKEVLAGGNVINWVGHTTKGLAGSPDMLHEANYGACMCAARSDLLAIGGADEHLDYLGYICGPHEMTFRLVNDGCVERWLEHEWIYHTWHPGVAGGNDLGGPHDGRNFSLRTLELRENRRVRPWVENPVVDMLSHGTDMTRQELLEHMVLVDRSDWRQPNRLLRTLGPVELVQENVDGFNIIRDKRLFVGLHQSEGPYLREKIRNREFEKCFCGTSVEEVVTGVREGTRSKLWAQLGWTYYHRRLYDEARRAFDSAVSLDADNVRAISGRSWTALQLREVEQAQQGFEIALTMISFGPARRVAGGVARPGLGVLSPGFLRAGDHRLYDGPGVYPRVVFSGQSRHLEGSWPRPFHVRPNGRGPRRLQGWSRGIAFESARVERGRAIMGLACPSARGRSPVAQATSGPRQG
jgi:hypothetical protein